MAKWFENERKQWDRIEAAAAEAERFLNRVAALRAAEAERFLNRVAALRAAASLEQALPPPENAAMKRASLDLSKSLVLVRKERWQ